jgi:hypothetical protein
MTADIVTIIRANPECYAPALMQQAADEIELLRIGVATALKERDEARRERDDARRKYCHEIFVNGGIPPGDFAKHLGWDCFPQKDGK